MTASKSHKALILKNIVCSLALPVIVWLVMECIDRAAVGVGVISTSADLKNLARSLMTSFCFALALNVNLMSGRMDLSAGAQMYLACIFGGNLALQLGLGGVGVLVFSIVVGAAAGFVVGFIYVKLRILPMVLGLGMTLVYECMSFAAYKQQGLQLFGMPGVEILSNVGFIVVVYLVVIVSVSYLFQFSAFGYKRRAIQGNQRLSVDSGINIYTNCLACYTLAGALVAIAGVFDTAFKGALVPVMGMSSNGTVFSNMFPMFLGIWLSRFSSPIIGIFIGSLSVRFLSIGLSKLPLDGNIQTVIVYSIFLLFMIYRMNEDRLQYAKVKKVRVAAARQARSGKVPDLAAQ